MISPRPLLAALLISFVALTTRLYSEEAPTADETGMVPGDLVFGNQNTFPGHVGIYIGKWESLPESLRTKYAEAYENAIIYSSDEGLKKSFLVADAYSPRTSLR